jgi:hypothetical protein
VHLQYYISSSTLLLTSSKFMGFSSLFLLNPLRMKDSIVKRFMHCNFLLQHFCAHKYFQNSHHKTIGTLKSVDMYRMYNTNNSLLSTYYCCDVHSFFMCFVLYFCSYAWSISELVVSFFKKQKPK